MEMAIQRRGAWVSAFAAAAIRSAGARCVD